MNTLKRILNYSVWTLVSIVFAFIYMRIILGPKPEEPTGFLTYIVSLIYEFAFVRLGLILGGIFALIYILVDIFYLNKRLKKSRNSTIIRVLIIAVIAIIICTTHYILEKVIDVI
ncbi:hypothetical protein [Winogradskyella thalassocola]|uniref:Uncharacterized protein n=1 Tax=Winogradskyella thalassocola TaxID=262004 RepID=A0A1G8CU36_9FLAO|nr:hypothetical protein [Winogradskyella thalassocola]SDH49001.1 hypothetical protein SAMN04489796_10349 [Winogradskyella thalassocola]